MTVRPWLLLLILASAACTGSRPPRIGPDPGSYVLRDTTEYEHVLSGGYAAVLVRDDGMVLDTADLFFGVHRLNTGALVFLPVRSDPIEEFEGARDVTEYVAFDGRRRVVLNRFLPHFSDYFSSPAVIDGVLYYWGLERIVDGDYRVHAVCWDARARRVRTRFLEAMELATDNRGYFAPPDSAAGMIRFVTPTRTHRLEPRFGDP